MKSLVHIALIFSFFNAFGLELKMELDTNRIAIGDQLQLTISLDQLDSNIQTFSFTDTLSKNIEVIEFKDIEKTKNTTKQNITITCWDTGFYVIPPITLGLENGDSIASNPVLFQVLGFVLDPKIDLIGDKGNLEKEFHWTEYKTLIYTVLLVFISLALITLILILIIVKNKKTEIALVVPDRPYMEVILERINKLEEDKLWQAGLEKVYQSEISSILRSFFEGKFKIKSLEETSNNILNQLKTSSLNSEDYEKSHQILMFSDLVKFAKAKGTQTQHEKSLIDLKSIINNNKPKEEIE